MIRGVMLGVIGLSAAAQTVALAVVLAQPVDQDTVPTNGTPHPTPTVTVTVTPSPAPTLAPVPRPIPTPTPTTTPTPSRVVIEPTPFLPLPTVIPIPAPAPIPTPTCTPVPGHEKHSKAIPGEHIGWVNSERSCIGPRR